MNSVLIGMRVPGVGVTRLGVLLAVLTLSYGCSTPAPSPSPSPPPRPAPSTPQALTITGQVTEPAADLAPVDGANVCWGGSGANPRCAQTGADGTYVLVTDWPNVRPGARVVLLAPFVYKGASAPTRFELSTSLEPER